MSYNIFGGFIDNIIRFFKRKKKFLKKKSVVELLYGELYHIESYDPVKHYVWIKGIRYVDLSFKRFKESDLICK